MLIIITSVTVLLENGADMHYKNAKGESALAISVNFPVFQYPFVCHLHTNNLRRKLENC